MRLVVDTNILFSFFWKGSVTRKLITSGLFELFSPDLALKEVQNNKSDVCSKSKLSDPEFVETLEYLRLFVTPVKEEKFKDFAPEASKLLPEHAKDIPFFTLAMYLKADAWSNEKRWKAQDRIRVFNTKELIEFACKQGFSFV